MCVERIVFHFLFFFYFFILFRFCGFDSRSYFEYFFIFLITGTMTNLQSVTSLSLSRDGGFQNFDDNLHCAVREVKEQREIENEDGVCVCVCITKNSLTS